MTFLDYQFDSPDADVILITTERDCTTEFHVHRCILAAASPFFADMFSLPQIEDEVVGKISPIPEIPVSESSHILDTVLRYVYPVPQPTIESFDELTLILGAAIKYDFTTTIHTLRSLLISPRFLQTLPIRVYAVACQYDFDEEAKLASQHTLNVNILDTTAPPLRDLKYISAYEYHQLLRLHALRARKALSLLVIPDNIKCMQCNGSAFTMNDAPQWWYQFEKKAREELSMRPTTEVIFSLEFVFGAARAAGCSRCPESILDSWNFLQGLKESIDKLPATVEMDHDYVAP